MRGAVAAVMIQEGLTPRYVAALKKSLDATRRQVSDLVGEMHAQLRLHEQLRSEDRVEAVAAVRRRSVRAWRLWRRQRARHSDEVTRAISAIRSVQATYEEALQIKAPVEYWRQKADEHRANRARYRNILLGYAGVSGLALLVGLGSLAYQALQLAELPDVPPAVFVILGAVGVVVTTAVFWAARILVRLFMSEHHLAIDSAERGTMAMTYLALTEKKAAEEKDRAIVLASLFRPTSDGIVKDDAAPDFGPAALLSKVLDKK
jgi:hypothetical protein